MLFWGLVELSRALFHRAWAAVADRQIERKQDRSARLTAYGVSVRSSPSRAQSSPNDVTA